jgi:hypothetical protein
MKTALPCLLIALLAGAGCTSKSKARQQAQAAYVAGQQAAHETQLRQAGVSFIGEVRNPIVPWTEDLTLARGILAAQYLGRLEPRQIFLNRGGQQFPVNPRDLLRGDEGPLLQPGDVVELRR